MRKAILLVFVCVLGAAMTAMAAGPPAGNHAAPPTGGSANPFQDKLDALAETDKSDPPAKNGVEFVGSSMLEGWVDVAAHMAPLPAFNRAIGGSKTGDILSHLDPLVLQYEPKVVILYSGINDVSEGVSVTETVENLRNIIGGIQAVLPETRVIYIPMLNTSNRPDTGSMISEANQVMAAYAEKNSRTTLLDVSPALVDQNGDTRPEFLTTDGSHYNDTAYEAMARVVKPAVEEIWSR